MLKGGEIQDDSDDFKFISFDLEDVHNNVSCFLWMIINSP